MNRHPVPAFDLFNVLFERIYDPSIHIVLSFDGRLDESAMETATERLIGANPYLGSRFRVVDGVPAWEEVPDDRRETAFSLHEHDRDPEVPPLPLDVRTAPQVRVGLFRGRQETPWSSPFTTGSVTSRASFPLPGTSSPHIGVYSTILATGPPPRVHMTGARTGYFRVTTKKNARGPGTRPLPSSTAGVSLWCGPAAGDRGYHPLRLPRIGSGP